MPPTSPATLWPLAGMEQEVRLLFVLPAYIERNAGHAPSLLPLPFLVARQAVQGKLHHSTKSKLRSPATWGGEKYSRETREKKNASESTSA